MTDTDSIDALFERVLRLASRDTIVLVGKMHAEHATLRAERDALAAQVKAVRAIHSQENSKYCPGCSYTYMAPCPTTRALSEQEGT